MKVVKGDPVSTHHYEKELNWFDKLFVKTYDRDEGLNLHMFKEDFLNIIHHGNRSSGNLFHIETNNDDLTDRLLNNVETRYGPSPADKVIAELIEEIAQSLMWYGRAIYYLHDDDEKAETHVVSYSSESIFRFARIPFQYLPSRVVRNWGSEDVTKNRELRILDARKTLSFKWPTSIRQKICAQNKVLATSAP